MKQQYKSIRVKKQLWKRLKTKATELEISINQLIETLWEK